MSNEGDYISAKKAQEMLGVKNRALRSYIDKYNLKTKRLLSGRIGYDKQCILDLLERSLPKENKERICYARVSSQKQKSDLGRQEHFFKSEFPEHRIVSDIGSGINWKRKGLNSILELCMQGKVSEIVVAHRDRLCRFAFELLQTIFTMHNVKLIVLDKTEYKSREEELSDDIMSIIQVYSCRKNGARRYSIKNEEDKDIPDTKTSNDIQEMEKHS